MSIPLATKNEAIAAVVIDSLSLHTAWPGVTGANEATGGSPAYARKSVTTGTVSNGAKSTTAGVTFDVAAGTYRYIGMWASSVFVGAMTNGGALPQNFVAMPSTDRIAATAHGFNNSDKLVFINGTPPAGITEGATYYALNVTTDTFQVSATPGGSVVDITAASSFGCVLSAIIEQVFASQGTLPVTTVSLAVPD